jgi:hypothetical protein
MRIGRTIIVPAIVTLGLAGATLAASATAVTAAHVSSVQVQAQGPVAAPGVLFHS